MADRKGLPHRTAPRPLTDAAGGGVLEGRRLHRTAPRLGHDAAGGGVLAELRPPRGAVYTPGGARPHQQAAER